MSHNNRAKRMERVVRRRGRTPIKSTHKVLYIAIKKKSRSGIEYTNYKPVIVKND